MKRAAKSSPSGQSPPGDRSNDDFVVVDKVIPPSSHGAVTRSYSEGSVQLRQKAPTPSENVDHQGQKTRATPRSFSNQADPAERIAVSGLPPRNAPNMNSTAPTESCSTLGLHLADFSVDVSDLDKMRTFPSSVPLPDLDGDLEFLDFFDPFLGLPPKQIEAMALPPLNANGDGWSPLEHFSVSSQASMQDYGFHQVQPPTMNGSPTMDGTGSPSETARPLTRANFEQGPASWNGSPQQQLYGADIGDGSSPQLHQAASSKPPPLIFTDQMRASLLKDLSHRLRSDQSTTFRLPTAAALQKCIRTYVDAFHVHLPIFHLQTMDFSRTPSPLVLAICAIGALYRLERRTAAALYLKADQALFAAVDRGGHLHKKARLLEDWIRPPLESPTSFQESLWTSQTRLLLAMLSCFSGDTEVISKAIVHLGDFLIVSDTRRNQ